MFINKIALIYLQMTLVSHTQKNIIFLVLVLLRIDCSDQLSRNEAISLTSISPLRVNVSFSAYFVQVQV